MKAQSKTGTVEHESLESVFKSELTEVYYAQQRLGKTYEKMAVAANNDELKALFEGQVQSTALQIGRIEKCFEILELKADSKYADIVSGLIDAVKVTITDFPEGAARDTSLIAAAQKIEHYGISVYGTLRTIATLLGRIQCAELLEENKDEEAETDEALTRVAVSINQVALEGA